MHVRYYPFRRREGFMEVEMFPNSATTLILLKYDSRFGQKTPILMPEIAWPDN